MSKNPQNIPAFILAAMMLLLPAAGVPSELMLQDTLKSAIAAFSVLICALIFFWQQRNSTKPLQWHGLMWLPIALMLYALGSMAWSHTYLAAVEAIRWFIFSLLFWLTLNIFTRENFPLLSWGIHGGAVIASIWTALQFWFDFSFFPQYAFPASTFSNRNFLAEYLVCALPFSIWVIATMRQSKWLALISLTIALHIVAVMMTGARAATISMFIIIPLLLAIIAKYYSQFNCTSWTKITKIMVSVFIMSSVIVMGSIPSTNWTYLHDKKGSALQNSFMRTASITKPDEFTEGGSLSVRLVMWSATLGMIKNTPLKGVGAGAWEVQVPLYQRAGESMEIDYYAHDEYLQLLSEYGLIVGGLFLAILFAYLLTTLKKTWCLKEASALPDASLRAFILASLLALCLVSTVGFPWHLAGTGAIFAVCLGLLSASDTRLNIQETFFAASIRWNPIFSKLAVVLLICATLLAAYITIQASRVEYKIVQSIQIGNTALKLHSLGQKLPNERKERMISNMHEAIAINPHYRKISPIAADELATIGEWATAVWIWESMTASRPYVAAFWSSMAKGYARLGQDTQALHAAKIALQLQADAPGMHALEINFLSKSGEETQAKQLLVNYFTNNDYDFALTQSGYALGLKTHDWPLAIHSLELRNKKWPDKAADGYFRLGSIYIEMHDDAKALEAFKAGLQTVPADEKNQFKNQVPEPYRNML